MDEFLTREKAAEFLGVSTRTLDRYVSTKVLPAHRKGRRAVFAKSDLLALQKSPGQKPEISEDQQEHFPVKQNENLTALANLLEKMHDEIRRKDDVIFRLNFELGAAREKEKTAIPLLESGEKNAEKIKRLEETLFSARVMRTLFFGLFALSLGVIGVLVNFLFLS